MRLTNEIRETILRKLCDRKLRATEKKLEELQALVGDAIFESLCRKLPEHLHGLEGLQDWVEQLHSFTIRIRTSDCASEHALTYPNRNLRSGQYRQFQKHCLDIRFKFSGPRFVCVADRHKSPNHSDAMQVPAYKKWFNLLEKATAMREEIIAEVRPILLGATTAAQLLKVWPEVKPFLPPPPIPTRRDLVPVEKIAELNKLVALP